VERENAIIIIPDVQVHDLIHKIFAFVIRISIFPGFSFHAEVIYFPRLNLILVEVQRKRERTSVRPSRDEPAFCEP
jgi:hypothetical protein